MPTSALFRIDRVNRRQLGGSVSAHERGRRRGGKAALGVFVMAILLGASGGAPVGAQGGAPLELIDGGSVPATTLEGDLIAVFFASWSPRCRDVVERANRIERKWGSRAEVLLVDFQEEKPEVEAFLANKDVGVEVALDRDGAFAKKHGITTLPSLLVLEKGSVAFRGRLPSDTESVLAPIFD